MGPSYSPYPPPLKGGGEQKSLFRLLNMGLRSQNWVPMFCRSGRWLLCLSVMNTNSRNWGLIGLGNPIGTASIPRERAAIRQLGPAMPIGGQLANSIQSISPNSMRTIQLVELAKEAEIDAKAVVRPACARRSPHHRGGAVSLLRAQIPETHPATSNRGDPSCMRAIVIDGAGPVGQPSPDTIHHRRPACPCFEAVVGSSWGPHFGSLTSANCSQHAGCLPGSQYRLLNSSAPNFATGLSSYPPGTAP
jgi:hypothetical protein